MSSPAPQRRALLIGASLAPLRDLLVGSGFHVALADGGVDGMAELGANGADVCLLPLDLGDLSATELLVAARPSSPDACFLLVDDAGHADAIVAAWQAGLDGFVPVPVDAARLVDEIERRRRDPPVRRATEQHNLAAWRTELGIGGANEDASSVLARPAAGVANADADAVDDDTRRDAERYRAVREMLLPVLERELDATEAVRIKERVTVASIHETELDALRRVVTGHDEARQRLAGQLDDARAQLQQARAQLAERDAAHAAADAEHARLAASVRALSDDLAAARDDAGRSIAAEHALRTRLTAAEQALADARRHAELVQQQRDHERAAHDDDANVRAQLDGQRDEAHRVALEGLEQQRLRDRDELARRNARINELEAQARLALDDARAEHVAASARLEAAQQARIEELQREHGAALARQTAAHDEALAARKTELSIAVARQRVELDTRLAQQQRSHEAALLEVKASHMRELAAERAGHARAIEAVRAEVDDEKRRLADLGDVERKRLFADFEQKLRIVRGEVSTARADVELRLRSERAEMSASVLATEERARDLEFQLDDMRLRAEFLQEEQRRLQDESQRRLVEAEAVFHREKLRLIEEKEAAAAGSQQAFVDLARFLQEEKLLRQRVVELQASFDEVVAQSQEQQRALHEQREAFSEAEREVSSLRQTLATHNEQLARHAVERERIDAQVAGAQRQARQLEDELAVARADHDEVAARAERGARELQVARRAVDEVRARLAALDAEHRADVVGRKRQLDDERARGHALALALEHGRDAWQAERATLQERVEALETSLRANADEAARVHASTCREIDALRTALRTAREREDEAARRIQALEAALDDAARAARALPGAAGTPSGGDDAAAHATRHAVVDALLAQRRALLAAIDGFAPFETGDASLADHVQTLRQLAAAIARLHSGNGR